MAKQQTSGGVSRFYGIIGAVAVAGLLIVGYQVGFKGMGQAAAAPVAVEGLDDPQVLLQMAQGMVLGDPAAPVTIYEFGDYQCPACGMFALQVKPLVDQAYVVEGKAKFVFYDFPLVQIHPNAFIAARSSRCAADQGQDLYWEYHKKLFDEQGSWSNNGSPVGLFVGYAEALGANKGDFESCLRSDRHADVISAQMRLGEELGVTGTPSVMVSKGDGFADRLQSADFQYIQQAVDALLAESEGN